MDSDKMPLLGFNNKPKNTVMANSNRINAKRPMLSLCAENLDASVLVIMKTAGIAIKRIQENWLRNKLTVGFCH